MSKSILARRPGRRSAALLSAAAVAAAGLFAAASPAGAVINLGPPRASDGLPAYIVDGEGIAVAPCDTATPVRDCGAVFDPTDPAYWDAGGAAGPIKLSYSVSSPIGGRIARFTGSALAPGQYKIQDPWGTVTCQAPGGKMDCRLPGGRITTMLRQTTAPVGFVGTPNVNRTFTGSPTGFNRVVITGPGKFKASTERLAISGLMRANTAMSAINTHALTLGRPKNAAPVVKNVHYTSFGTAAARPTVRLAGANANAFKVRNTCGSVAPGRGCNIVVAFRPQQHVNKTVKARLLINDNGLAARRTVNLTGVGLAR